MRFKVDENLPVDVAALLASAGHEADTVADEKLGGVSDPDLASICRRERRALVTLDRGFADIRTYPPAEYPGIVVLRPDHQDKETVLRLAARMVDALAAHPLDRHLWILEPHRLRLRGVGE